MPPDDDHTGTKKIARDAWHRARSGTTASYSYQPPLEVVAGAAVDAGAAVEAAGGVAAVEAGGGAIVSAGAVVAGAAVVAGVAAPFSFCSLLPLHAPSATTSADARTIRVNFMGKVSEPWMPMDLALTLNREYEKTATGE
ncbi:MAG TPA: hypothetical protein VFH52_10660 [Rhodanobacteraceae bacterium]|nr:hypothetical protein [Rhodanobacteraceae bacterium]